VRQPEAIIIHLKPLRQRPDMAFTRRDRKFTVVNFLGKGRGFDS
jgi:hypothetical protein